jgi:hypothetical protein
MAPRKDKIFTSHIDCKIIHRAPSPFKTMEMILLNGCETSKVWICSKDTT